MVAGWHPQVLIRRRIVDHLDFTEQAVLQTGRNSPRSDVLGEEIAQPIIAKVHDHFATPTRVLVPLNGTAGKLLTFQSENRQDGFGLWLGWVDPCETHRLAPGKRMRDFAKSSTRPTSYLPP